MLAKYLDLSTRHLPKAEMLSITEAAPPRVIEHEYGAWVNVQRDDTDDVDAEFAEDGTFSTLAAILQYARELDPEINWINFDSDGETIEGLPIFEW